MPCRIFDQQRFLNTEVNETLNIFRIYVAYLVTITDNEIFNMNQHNLLMNSIPKYCFHGLLA